jgi:HSP20 family protein
MAALTKWVEPTFTNGNLFPTFSKMVENFFGRDFDSFLDMPKGAWVPAVNIVQNEKDFSVEVAAPGLKKEDFKVEVEDGILTISAEKKEEKEEKNKKYTRREYSYNSFCRSFAVPEGVKAEDIKAAYNEGILKISLPKTGVEKKKPMAKEVKIS